MYPAVSRKKGKREKERKERKESPKLSYPEPQMLFSPRIVHANFFLLTAKEWPRIKREFHGSVIAVDWIISRINTYV